MSRFVGERGEVAHLVIRGPSVDIGGRSSRPAPSAIDGSKPVQRRTPVGDRAPLARSLPLAAQQLVPFEHAQHRVRLTYRSEEHTSELQSLMRISYAVFCLK